MSTSNLRYERELQTFTSADLEDKSRYFQSPHHHLHRQNALQKMKWFATDQPERFNKGGPYGEDSIDYQFNSHGYRCDELTPSPILFLGCSYTFGVGLALEDVWAYQIARTLRLPYINLAYPGGSIQYMQRTLLKAFSTIKPSLVVALIPYNYRFEFVSSDQGAPLKVWSKSGITSPSFRGVDKDRTYAYELFSNQNQEEFNLLTGLFTIQSFLSTQNCRFAWTLWRYEEPPSNYFYDLANSADIGSHWQSSIFDSHIRWKDLNLKARDSSHPGPQFHKAYAEFILEQIKCLSIV